MDSSEPGDAYHITAWLLKGHRKLYVGVRQTKVKKYISGMPWFDSIDMDSQ
jgi:hypothetical protein